MKRHLYGSSLLVLTLLLLCAGEASGQSKAWESLGPEGGRIQSIAQDPANANTMLLSPYGYPSRIFKSTNRGATWSSFSTINEYVVVLTYDPTNNSIVYAFTTSAVNRSTNGGQTWTRYSLPTNYYLYDATIDPVTPTNLHVSCDAYNGSQWVPGYARSTDGGQHWAGQMFPATYGALYGVSVDPVNHLVVYAGGYAYDGVTYGARLYRSTDGGASFVEKAGTAISGIYVYDVVSDPVTASKVYAATPTGVYRSTNAGDAWTLLAGYVPGAYRLAISKTATNTIYAASTAGLPYKTTDGGTTWSAVGSGISGSGYYVMYVEPGASPYVFFGNNNGLYRSTNAGASWASCCGGVVSASITGLRNAPSAQATMYAAFLNNAVFKTTGASSGTVTWTRLPDFYSCTTVEDFAISAANPDKLYAMEGGT